MNNFPILVISILFLSCISCSQYSADVRAIPSLVLDPSEVDLGQIEPTYGEHVNVQIKATNAGDAHLAIQAISSSCGCAVVQSPRTSLAPGLSDWIIVQVRPGATLGPRNAVLRIHSNDPIKPSFELPITWRVQPKFTVEPSNLNFGTVHPGEPTTRLLSLKASDDFRDMDLKIAASSDEITWDWADDLHSDPFLEKRLIVSINPGNIQGERIGYLEILCNRQTENLQFKVPVHWVVISGLRTSPSALFSGSVSPSDPVVSEIIVRAESADSVTVSDVRHHDDSVPHEFDIRSISESGTLVVQVKTVAPDTPGVYRYKVILESEARLNSSGAAFAEVPWSIIVR